MTKRCVASLAGESALCLPHLIRAAALAQHNRQMRQLAAATAAMLETLHGQLDEFIRKQDRFRDERVTPRKGWPGCGPSKPLSDMIRSRTDCGCSHGGRSVMSRFGLTARRA